VTRRITVAWPDPRPFDGRSGAPIRLLAVSDEPDPTLDVAANRAALGHLDAVVGCGDLEPAYLGFLGDAFDAPVTFVRGNHDHGNQWASANSPAPEHLRSGRPLDVLGLTVVPLEWPGIRPGIARRDDWQAWLDVVRAAGGVTIRRLFGRRSPVLVISHAPPLGVGDVHADRYHMGFAGYLWLLRRLRPPLWLHGHTTPASVMEWQAVSGESLVANVTGSVLVELRAPVGSGPDA
jgi:uncharacterized protein